MKYRSTRGKAINYSFEDTVLTGLAPDGGLFIPHTIPALPADWETAWSGLTFQQLAVEILSLYIDPAEIPRSDLEALVDRSYATFRAEEVTPLRKVRDGFYVLELFHGPTFAFKDVALQFLGNLFEYFLERKNKGITEQKRLHRLTVVGATSGDTGSAAIYGLRGKKNISVFILFPRGRVSPIQEAQMTTVLDKNVHCLSVEGTFDDCQDIVKQLFNNIPFNTRHHLGAINSINWARILAQTVYYFHSYFSLLRTLSLQPGSPAARAVRPHYSVPTGNFGDILAGYYAYRMGLPAARLIVATNSNDILDRFFGTAAYERQAGGDGNVKETLSPAMDILVSSNFERLLWYLARETEVDGGSEMVGAETGLDEKLATHAGTVVDRWMKDLKENGVFRVRKEIVDKAKEIFDSTRVSDEETLETIRRYHTPADPSQASYILDPHTAVGVEAAERIVIRRGLTPAGATDVLVCLATAHPAKFASAVETALAGRAGFQFEEVLPPEFAGLLERERRIVSVPRAEERLVIEAVEKDLREEGIEWDE